MKHTFFVSLFFVLFVLGCNKEPGDSLNLFSKKAEIPPSEEQVQKPTMYVKEWGVWFYRNEEDAGKPSKEVKDKLYMDFGSKVTVLDEKNINGKDFFKVQLPDQTDYWVRKTVFVEKFIIINQKDVLCYKQPDLDYADTILLQPGDFGLFQREIDGWMLADFLAYRPKESGGDRAVVGEKWIKEGYTTDLRAAKEAFYLNRAYYYQFSKNKNREKAVEMLEKARNINVDADTEITYVIETLLEELKGTAHKESEGNVEIITITPDETPEVINVE
jgi:hypothetical protein